MFGFYAVRSLGPEGPPRSFSGQDLATRLLAELINRAAVLFPLLNYARDEEGKNEAEYVARLENFGSAVEVFLGDVEEARVRGVRAEFFALDDVDGRVVEGCAVMPEHLKEIGADWHAVKDEVDPTGLPRSLRRFVTPEAKEVTTTGAKKAKAAQ